MNFRTVDLMECHLFVDNLVTVKLEQSGWTPPTHNRYFVSQFIQLLVSSTRPLLRRFPSVESHSSQSSQLGPPVHQRSSSDSGQASSSIHLSIKSVKSLGSDISPPKTVPQPKPSSKAPSRMDLALEEMAKTNIIDVSDLSMGKDLGSVQ